MDSSAKDDGLNDKDRKLARQRWKILAMALQGERSANTCNNEASVRRFSTFGLLKTEVIPRPPGDDDVGVTWFKYTCPCLPDFFMNIRHLPGTVSKQSIFGFNNTGNVCVWPSEEVMCHYIQQHTNQFSGLSICELGGGMTCLAGVMTAMLSKADHIMITDGNEESVDNLKMIAEQKENKELFGNTKVTCGVLRWGCGPLDPSLQGKFDVVQCADCLFFKDGREDLVDYVHDLLTPNGKALMFAPRRGDTFDAFVTLANKKFHTIVEEQYDNAVWEIHTQMKAKGLEHYDEDIHFPVMLILEKLKGS